MQGGGIRRRSRRCSAHSIPNMDVFLADMQAIQVMQGDVGGWKSNVFLRLLGDTFESVHLKVRSLNWHMIWICKRLSLFNSL
jgi:hypothetical protein